MSTLPKFSARQRFNWGYHDAAAGLAYGHGRGSATNFGFRHLPPMQSPEEILQHHFDGAYAHGWLAGRRDYLAGVYTESSADAWNEYRRKPAK